VGQQPLVYGSKTFRGVVLQQIRDPVAERHKFQELMVYGQWPIAEKQESEAQQLAESRFAIHAPTMAIHSRSPAIRHMLFTFRLAMSYQS
jgi:hypothetical protein